MNFNFAGITEGDSSNTKRCSKCKLYLKKGSFSKNKKAKDGLQSHCKDCDKKSSKKWREENKQEEREYRKQWREDNPEYDKNYRVENKEQIQEYRDGRKEEKKIYDKKYTTQNRSNFLYNKYGITSKEYDDMVREQDNKCAICEEPESRLDDNGYPMRLCVDHDHVTGEVRGLLCSKCNLGIGYLRSDEGTDILLNAVCYIEIHNLDDEF